MMNGDQATELMRRAINILFVSNPRGTSLGVLLGVLLNGLLGFLSPWLKTFEAVSFASIKVWHLIGLGIFTMNLRPYLNRHDIDPAIVKAIAHIENEKAKGNLSEWHARKIFVDLQYEILKQVVVASADSKKSREVSTAVSVESVSDKSK